MKHVMMFRLGRSQDRSCSIQTRLQYKSIRNTLDTRSVNLHPRPVSNLRTQPYNGKILLPYKSSSCPDTQRPKAGPLEHTCTSHPSTKARTGNLLVNPLVPMRELGRRMMLGCYLRPTQRVLGGIWCLEDKLEPAGRLRSCHLSRYLVRTL